MAVSAGGKRVPPTPTLTANADANRQRTANAIALPPTPLAYRHRQPLTATPFGRTGFRPLRSFCR